MAVHPALDRALDRFPVVRKRVAGRWTCTGLPLRAIEAIALAVVGDDWAQDLRVDISACRCSLKTQVIPQQRLDAWTRAMQACPFGAGVTAAGGRYLG
eukprot:10010745-Lingulodinium_polyedra.AAC.1